MTSPDATWRDHPFKKDEIYAVQESFAGFPNSEFVAGHNYVFDGVAYSHYDSSTIFTFHELGQLGLINGWWHDDQPDSLCRQHFKVSNENRT